MKIIEIHIYGYGKLENYVMKNISDFQVFYGENEAGKSTIMMFIHSILFGFPTKQQTELRFEPKTGASYGGKLVLFFSSKGKVVVERVKGKATGDVSVILEDGTRGGEELLSELLSYVDKSLYQSIFSFNLQGLQNVHLLKNEDLGKFLFSAGTFGSERLMAVEAKLQKELDNYFKPSGKKPVLNEKLAELKELSIALKEAGEQNNQYMSLIGEKDNLKNEVEQVQSRLKSLQFEIGQLQQWGVVVPLLREEEAIRAELQLFADITFPIDGIRRLDQLNQLIKPYEGQFQSISERIETIQSNLEKDKPNEQLLLKEIDIIDSIERLPLLEQLKQEEQKLKQQFHSIEIEIAQIKEKLHISINEDDLLLCNTSIYMKEQVEAVQKEYLHLLDKKQELDEKFSDETLNLKNIESKISSIENQLLPIEEKRELEKRMASFVDKENLERELYSIQEKIGFFSRLNKKQKQQKNRNRIVLMFLTIIAVVIAILGFVNEVFPLIIGGAVGAIVLLVMIFINQNDKEMEQEVRELKKKEANILRQLQDSTPNEHRYVDNILKKDAEIREQYKVWMVKKEQQEEHYDKIIQAFAKWEQRIKEMEQKLTMLGKELMLPEKVTKKHIYDGFILLEKWKQYIREKNSVERQIVKISEDMESIISKMRDLSTEYLGQMDGSNFQAMAIQLRELIKKENEKQVHSKEKKAKLTEWQEELRKLTIEINYLHEERQALFELAKVENEEEFRKLGKKDEKRAVLLTRLEEIERQYSLASITHNLKEKIMAISNIEQEITEKQRIYGEVEQSLAKLLERAAEVKHGIQVLEDGGTYSDLLHRFKQKRYEFSVEAKHWACLSVAKDILSKTVEKYKNERLPTLLAKAEEYLSFFTNEEYTRIHAKEFGSGLLIERKDHTLFEANELSQATAEQVYVALRLALATTLFHKYYFPIIIDDSFVNFDQVRTEKVIKILQSIEGHQILFFTCHKHLLPYFQGKEYDILFMGRGVK